MVLLREREEAIEVAILSSIDKLAMRLALRLPRCTRSGVKRSHKAMPDGNFLGLGMLNGQPSILQKTQG